MVVVSYFCNMKHWFISFFITLAALVFGTGNVSAQTKNMSTLRSEIPGGYPFWVCKPLDYNRVWEAEEFGEEPYYPVILFLHGRSLCGRDMKRVLRYGTLDAVEKGLNVPALIVAPQNPGGPWNPKKLNDILDWVMENCAADPERIYVLGMSLGGYGTLDYVGTYPERVAAAMALCGGSTLRDYSRMGEAPLWIIHGTADRAVSVNESKKVVNAMKAAGNDSRLRYDWFAGSSHGALARMFYLQETYDWLFSHSLADPGRPVNRKISITKEDLRKAYKR